MVADAFEVLGDEDQFERGEDDAGIPHHVGKQFTENLVAVVVHAVVGGEDFLREVDVPAKDAESPLGDIHGLIADALQVNVDARNGQRKTEIHRHELVQGKKLNDAIVDFQLELVDGVFFLEDAPGERLIGFQDSVNGLVNSALREAAHPEEALFHLVQVFFEMAFHEPLPSRLTYNKTKRDFSLRSK